MKTKFILLWLLALVVFVYGCYHTTQQTSYTQPTTPTTPTTPETPTQPSGGAEAKTVTVEITSAGFSPQIITINAGDTVKFVNKDSAQHRPASAVHPTHTVYPEPGGCIGSKFDACRGLLQGESFSFTFNQKGSWKYHDHLNPSSTGTINVV